MVYPFDRGTNYAVKLGREVAKMSYLASQTILSSWDYLYLWLLQLLFGRSQKIFAVLPDEGWALARFLG
jgi:hypothetical protein